MTTNHLGMARAFAEKATGPDAVVPLGALPGVHAQLALAHANMAIAEQQRLANMIALASLPADTPTLGEQVAQDARNALAVYQKHDEPDMGGWFQLRPEVADALGIHTEVEQ